MDTFIIIIICVIALYIVFRIFKTLLKWLIIGILVMVVIAFFSNPDESKHKDRIKEIASSLPFKIKDNAISVADYKIFSITKVKVNGEDKIVGIGAFGKVWHFDGVKDSKP